MHHSRPPRGRSRPTVRAREQLLEGTAHGTPEDTRPAVRRAPASDALRRYDEVARLLTGNRQATADDAARWTRELVRELDIPTLRAHGITAADAPAIAEAAIKASSMKANPLPLTREELMEILGSAL